MSSLPPPISRRSRLIVWLWRYLPVRGHTRLLIAYLFNLRYAVGVAAVVVNPAGEVLLLRHTYRRGGFEWGLPGGWATGRESMERAIMREIREETGFMISVERLVDVFSGYSLPRLTIIYLARIVAGTFRPSAEVSHYAFRPPGDLGQILPGERQAVLRALSGSARSASMPDNAGQP